MKEETPADALAIRKLEEQATDVRRALLDVYAFVDELESIRGLARQQMKSGARALRVLEDRIRKVRQADPNGEGS